MPRGKWSEFRTAQGQSRSPELRMPFSSALLDQSPCYPQGPSFRPLREFGLALTCISRSLRAAARSGSDWQSHVLLHYFQGSTAGELVTYAYHLPVWAIGRLFVIPRGCSPLAARLCMRARQSNASRQIAGIYEIIKISCCNPQGPSFRPWCEFGLAVTCNSRSLRATTRAGNRSC